MKSTRKRARSSSGPAPDKLWSEWNKRPVYWATISYLRWWWSSDGVRLATVIREGGFTAKTLRNMAVEYNVNRGVAKAEDGSDPAAGGICRLLNRRVVKWPDKLIDRAEFCKELLAQAIGNQWVHNHQISLFTKAMWFLRPEGWTPFDQYAASGLRVRPSSVPCERMMEFYRTLEGIGFAPLVREMQRVIDRSSVNGLPATRIVDTALMARGGRRQAVDPTWAPSAFLNLLPEGVGRAIEFAATQLQREFGDHRILNGNAEHSS